MGLPQREVTLFLCECGYSICCGVRAQGERLGFLVFFDGQEASETYGERITCRPGCDARLDYRLLLHTA
jgi:hypothetical protein